MKIYLAITEEIYQQGYFHVDKESDDYEVEHSLKALKESITKDWRHTNNFYVVTDIKSSCFTDTTYKYLKPNTTVSLKGLQPQLIFEEEYRKCLEVKPSKIHGKGLFVNSSFRKDTCLFVAIKTIDDNATIQSERYKVTELGKWVNHSKSPNGKLIKLGGLFFFKLIRNVSANTELTGDYYNAPIKLDVSFDKATESLAYCLLKSSTNYPCIR